MSNILNLDRVLTIFFGRDIFIDLKDSNKYKCVDVRSIEEYNESPLLEFNVPVINKNEHSFLHRHKYLAGIIVAYGLFKNRDYIKTELLKISNNKQNKLLIACSRGRLRSPCIWLYARHLGINCKILKYGIKSYKNKKTSGD